MIEKSRFSIGQEHLNIAEEEVIMNSTTKKVTYTGLMMGLCLIGTFIVQIQISPTGGYIHLGDAFVFLSGILLGPVYGAIAAGIGSAMADVLAGWAAWAVPTLIVKGAMAFIVGYAFKQKGKVSTLLTSQSLFIGYVAIWTGLIIIVNRLFTHSTEDLSGQNGFFDFINTLIENADSNRLIVITIMMVLPLVFITLYKVIGTIIGKEISFTANLSMVVAGSLMVVLYYIT